MKLLFGLVDMSASEGAIRCIVEVDMDVRGGSCRRFKGLVSFVVEMGLSIGYVVVFCNTSE
jgi:hypothetical protein